jgi:two-component system, probable response regulator PhcQ
MTQKCNKEYKILYVDDELKALKYFKKYFENDFEVFTAENVDDGWGIIEEHGGDIAILVTDQRMPIKQGVELLEQVRMAYPKIMRILTTAYSDLSSAIDAVNKGAIFQYVEKPWDLPKFKQILHRALDFYLIQQERDLLLQEKLHVLQRLIITDRIQSLAVLATGLPPHTKNATAALVNYLEFMPRALGRMHTDQAAPMTASFWNDLEGFSKCETDHLLIMIRKLIKLTSSSGPQGFEESRMDVMLETWVDSLEDFILTNKTKVILQKEADISGIKLDVDYFQNCFINLLKNLILFYDGNSINVNLKKDVVNTVPGVFITLKSDTFIWDDVHFSSFFSLLVDQENTDLSLALLSLFIIVFHHSGTVNLNRDSSAIEIFLPEDPTSVDIPPVDDAACFEKLYQKFEKWDAELL